MILKTWSFAFFCILLIPTTVKPQDLREASGYFTDPHGTPFGTICTNSYSSSLYIVQDGSPEELLSASGCGAYYTISFDRRFVGLKIIDSEGKQTPAVFDLATRTTRNLSKPDAQSGQVSFTRDGRMAFTRGEQLVIVDELGEHLHALGAYANLAPISPDGEFVAYNDLDDQIWLLNLQTEQRTLLTDGRMGYFNPLWSPDGKLLLYSSLSGMMRVYDLRSGKTYDLGEGFHPSWSQESRQIVCYRKEFQGSQVVNTDLYLVQFDGTSLTRLTFTPGVMEMDPSFSDDGTQVMYQTCARRTIGFAPVSRSHQDLQSTLLSREIALPGPERFSIKPLSRLASAKNTLQLDIPYVHQAYDTPDWFNGDWACAPTEAIMLLAYYNILPKWPTYCSTPRPHYNDWGNYVSTQYQFRQVQYIMRADDASGRPAWGGYGYMWTGSEHPYSKMADYFRGHGLSATQTDATPYNVAFDEVSSGRPFNMCVMLTISGHLVLAHGIGAEPHTFVFNDPWGDKNRGYKNYYGKNASYDWPGYNNGFQNLTGVAWCIATQYSAPSLNDTIVDDLQFGQGFVMQTASPSSMTLWKDRNLGYQGHAWYAYTRGSGLVDTCFAVWTPTLPDDGVYEVAVYVPSFANAVEARYVISYSGGSTTKLVDQSLTGNSWVSLGTYPFTKGADASVRLGDESSVPGQVLGFDAVRWSRTLASTTDVRNAQQLPREFLLHQNYPNPFNPSTIISFQVPAVSLVRLEVVDVLGREVTTLVNDVRPPGTYTVRLEGSALRTGVYYYRLQAGEFVATKKMVLLR